MRIGEKTHLKLFLLLSTPLRQSSPGIEHDVVCKTNQLIVGVVVIA